MHVRLSTALRCVPRPSAHVTEVRVPSGNSLRKRRPRTQMALPPQRRDDPSLPPPWQALYGTSPACLASLVEACALCAVHFLTRSRAAPPADPNSGNTYYWNPVTNVTQYERPAGAPPPLAAPVRPQPCAGGCLSLLPTPRPLTLVSHHRQTAAATAAVTVVGVGTVRCVPEMKALGSSRGPARWRKP